jgi:hypothetical protein
MPGHNMPEGTDEDSIRAALSDRLRRRPGRCPRCSSTKLVHVRGSLASGGDICCAACQCRWSTVWSRRKAVVILAIVLMVVGYAATQLTLNLLTISEGPDAEAASSVRAYGLMLAAALFFSFPFVRTGLRVMAGRALPRVLELGEK